ncbi:hypothetical protein GCM10007984_03300 [Shewanella putrefaciens]|nr:hypothetical protein GCM10007984_03300 [Shewanella putrefaciens]
MDVLGSALRQGNVIRLKDKTQKAKKMCAIGWITHCVVLQITSLEYNLNTYQWAMF